MPANTPHPEIIDPHPGIVWKDQKTMGVYRDLSKIPVYVNLPQWEPVLMAGMPMTDPSLPSLLPDVLAPSFAPAPALPVAAAEPKHHSFSGFFREAKSILTSRTFLSVVALAALAVAILALIEAAQSRRDAQQTQIVSFPAARLDSVVERADSKARAMTALGASEHDAAFARNAEVLEEGMTIVSQSIPQATSGFSSGSGRTVALGAGSPSDYRPFAAIDADRQVRTLLGGITVASITDHSATIHGASALHLKGADR